MIKLSFFWFTLQNKIGSIADFILQYVDREPGRSVLVKLLRDEGGVLLNAVITVPLLIE